MRKIHLFFHSLFLIAFLTACTDESITAQSEAASTHIEVTNNSAQQITSIELKLYQKEMVQASPTAMNADESLIVMGETVDFSIQKQDINFDELVTIEVVAMIDGVEISAGKTGSMTIEQGERYLFELARDPELQLKEIKE